MSSFLSFAYVSPFAAFGGVTVGERRASQERPAKSAILGLVAGALGIDRDDGEAHHALDRDLFLAVRTDDLGRSPRRLISDYHTTQVPPRGRNQRYATRRDEVADRQNLGTILSSREYRSDCSFTIVLWARSNRPRFSLEEIACALRAPVFTPYAGRKACPLMLPMYPLIVEAADVRSAFEQRDTRTACLHEFLRECGLLAAPHELAIDAAADEPMNGGRTRRERRRDQVLDRRRWQFTFRDEIVGPWNGGAQ